MNKFNEMFKIFILMLPVGLFVFPGCEFIGDVFKAGIWVGVVIVIAVIAVILFIAKMFKG